MTEFSADEIRDFTKLKRLREAGYFESEGSVPMPEIITDGEEPALADLLDARRPVYEFDYRDAERRALQSQGARRAAQTTMFCAKACQRMTQHGMVATYDTGDPVFHCNICCACHLCCARLAGSERLYEAVNDIGDKLAAWEAEGGTVSSPTFCTECGAMLRCSVCVGDGPGGYCRGCGQKGCAVEGCDAS
ncbi:hypothetical protein LCGC14_1963210 [marine sediment metagenome]|uniref:Uncharacterized protein n=1 Tax=marine sediment metagenome TaxID=412755 RepID=A0A0F9FDV2_9ZZZZ